MTDWLHKLLKTIDYNRFLTAGVVASLALVVFLMTACESLTPSLVTPTEKVSRVAYLQEAVQVQTSLEIEKAEVETAVAAVNARILAHNEMKGIGLADLERQDELRARILEIAGMSAGQLLPDAALGMVWPALSLVTSLLGGGALVDNVRKRKVIDVLKNGGSPANGSK